MEKMSLKTLPECYRQKLKLPASYAKTPIDAARKPEDVLTYIPGKIQNILCLKQYDSILNTFKKAPVIVISSVHLATKLFSV
jgi:hypothetical protein